MHGALIAVGLLAAFYFLIYGPRDNEKAALGNDVAKLEDELENARAVAELRPVLERQIEEMGQKLEFYERRLPNAKEVPKLLMELRRAVEEEEVQLEALKAGDPENRGMYTTVPFEVEVTSGFHQLGKFVNRLESGERFLAVEDLAVEAGRGDKDPRTRTGKLVVSTFWFNALTETRRGVSR
jgi:type IV pilus assembly protein PilO